MAQLWRNYGAIGAIGAITGKLKITKMHTLAAEILSYLPPENFFILAATAEVFVECSGI
jgi:hypothetical protein